MYAVMTEKEMEKMMRKQRMLCYLQGMMDDYKKWEGYLKDGKNLERYGEILHDKLIGMIACKELVECLIEEPVNLQSDGKVTVGF